MCEVRHQDSLTVGAMFIDGQGPQLLKAISAKSKRPLASAKS